MTTLFDAARRSAAVMFDWRVKKDACAKKSKFYFVLALPSLFPVVTTPALASMFTNLSISLLKPKEDPVGERPAPVVGIHVTHPVCTTRRVSHYKHARDPRSPS